MLLPRSSTAERPKIAALIVARITATDVIFIPPLVDPGDAPIYERIMMSNKLAWCKWCISTAVNPPLNELT